MHRLKENGSDVNRPLLWDSDNGICPGHVMQTPVDISAGSPHTWAPHKHPKHTSIEHKSITTISLK